MKHIIKSVDETSPLRKKVHPGWNLLAVNGHEIRDVLDYKYYSYDPRLLLEFETPDGKKETVRMRKGAGEDPGLNFETYLMDAPRSCANNCIFCFVDQTPPGMRPSLYFKDDDARLSFLMGNYLTLTNLSEREAQRICDLHISPINVSVHTTDPSLRCRMMGNRRAGEKLALLEKFAASGISLNCQIVCCPGWNDGEELQRTMEDLQALGENMTSCAVVPVGLTRYREGLPEIRPFTPETASEIIDLVEAFADAHRDQDGQLKFFCSDEFYIMAHRSLPEDAYYGDYPQLDNGVGMLRLLETEFKAALRGADGCDGVPFSIACGEAAYPYIRDLVDLAKASVPGLSGQVYAIHNDFFGENVTVSGLITGKDLIRQLKDRPLGRRLFLSANMLRRDEQDFLDDVKREEAAEALGVEIYPVDQDGGALFDAITGCLPPIPVPRRGSSTEDTQYNKYN